MQQDNSYNSSQKNPFALILLLIILITIPLSLLLVSQRQEIRKKASEVTGFNKGARYEILSDLPDEYPIKVTRNTLDQFFTEMGVFKANGVYDFATGRPATVNKIVVHLTKAPQPYNRWMEGGTVLQSTGDLMSGQTVHLYIYVSSRLLSYSQDFRSSRFYSAILEGTHDLVTSPAQRSLLTVDYQSPPPSFTSLLVEKGQNGYPNYTIQILKTN